MDEEDGVDEADKVGEVKMGEDKVDEDKVGKDKVDKDKVDKDKVGQVSQEQGEWWIRLV